MENDENNDQLPVEFEWTKLQEDWSGFMLFAQQQLLHSSTKLRTGFINARLIPLAARAGQFGAETPLDGLLNVDAAQI